MDINIIDKNFSLTLYGISGIAVNCNWTETGFKLMDEMWKQVKAGGLKHKGMNVWVYEDNNKMFAGVEIEGAGVGGTTLEPKTINLPKYAYYKHIGPYKLIRQAGQKMTDELKEMLSVMDWIKFVHKT